MRVTAIFLVTLLAGCQTLVIPPLDPPDPVTIYLTDYGKHSSVLLPADEGGYQEYAFGDWRYFAEGKTSIPVALQALIGSPRATLGRRLVSQASVEGDLAAALGSKRLMSFQAPRPRVQGLADSLNHRFAQAQDAPYYSNYSSLYHIPDDEHYWAGNNCNHVTANWLRELGCTVSGPAIFSNFIVTAPQPAGPRPPRIDAPPGP